MLHFRKSICVIAVLFGKLALQFLPTAISVKLFIHFLLDKPVAQKQTFKQNTKANDAKSHPLGRCSGSDGVDMLV